MIRHTTLSLCVVLAAGSCFAQTGPGKRVTARTADIHVMTQAEAPEGVTMVDTRARDADRSIYDNTRGEYVFWFVGGPTRVGLNAIMDFTQSIPNPDGSYDIDRFSWGVGPNGDPGVHSLIDFSFVFFDSADVSGDSSLPAGKNEMVGIGIGTFDLDSTYFYSFTIQFGSPIHLNDRGMYVELWMTDHTTGQQLPRGRWTWLYQDTFNFDAWVPTIAVGQSDPLNWQDSNDDAQITSDEGAVYLGGRHSIFFKMESPNNRWCPADFNRDGFPDIFDFTDFVTAFESGC